MKRVGFSSEDLTEKMPNKYAAVIVIASRAKAIRENPADVEETEKKLKAPVIAIKEFQEGKLKYPEFDVEKINQEE
jgi:DNA-directed RNA polymerase omega subunit